MKDPVAMATRSNDETLYVGQRSGYVWAISNGRPRPKPVLDVSSEVSVVHEQGLLGMAFSPDGARLYLSYADRDVVLRIVEFRFRADGVVPGSRRDVLAIPQPTVRHHGGDIAFGPDGYLWISTGDGSLGNDALRNAQSLGSLLGKLLRVDPSPSRSRSYRIPPDNPFINRPGARPEIYAFGFRNPWRFSFDQTTGDLWIGDVGQYWMEEVDFLHAGEGAGANFGWSLLEGTLPFRGKAPRNHVPPLYQYPHDRGMCAVIGGYVYRGRAIDGLQGAYVYTDWCQGRPQALVQRDGRFRFGRGLGVKLDGVASFGQGPDGELYLLSLSKGVYRLSQNDIDVIVTPRFPV